MKPRMLNNICAHPIIISWVLGASVLNGLLIGSLLAEVPLRAIVTDWQVMLYLLVVLISATLLGYFLGMLTVWPLFRVVCSKINGAPLKLGDQVIILSGPHKGTIAEVYKVIDWEPGWERVRLDLGEEHKEHFADIFEEYSLLKLRKSEQDVILNEGLP